MGNITVATVAMNVCFDKQQNIKKYLSFIEEAAQKGAKLIVFPEQSLQGYLPSLVGPYTIETIRYQYANAEVIPEGEATQIIVQAAKKYDMYIIWGMTERDRNRFDVLYNTAVLVGPEGFIGSYRKVHQPNDELHIYTPGNEFPVYDTKIGKIGMLICYDKCFPEATRELVLKGSEIFVSPTAWSKGWKGADQKADRMGYLYELYDCVRACENQCWFISSNHVGVSGDTDYYGHSNIVDPGGVVIATTGGDEGIAYTEADLRGEILRSRTEYQMVCMLRDMKPHAYPQLCSGQGVLGATPIQNKDNVLEVNSTISTIKTGE